ncbi:MAG TPA: ApaG domain, partial [Opitutaceae bacterium]|nr:ApaG domain [Opitutaceae bacterium]
MPSSPQEVQGLTAHLDQLCHHFGGPNLPPGKPHAFVYYITISNASDRVVTLLGRKWVIVHADGTHLVVEGDWDGPLTWTTTGAEEQVLTGDDLIAACRAEGLDVADPDGDFVRAVVAGEPA